MIRALIAKRKQRLARQRLQRIVEANLRAPATRSFRDHRTAALKQSRRVSA